MDDGRSQALAVSQPGELPSDVRARLRERARLAPKAPGALWNPGRAALLPIVGTEGGGAAVGFASPSGTWLQEAGIDEADLPMNASAAQCPAPAGPGQAR